MDVMACLRKALEMAAADFREIMASASGPPESTVMFSGSWGLAIGPPPESSSPGGALRPTVALGASVP